MQIRVPEVYDLLPFRILNVSIPDIPFFGYLPIKDLGAGRNLVYFQRDMLLYPLEGRPYAVSRNTAEERVEIRHQLMNIFTWGNILFNIHFSCHSHLQRPTTKPRSDILNRFKGIPCLRDRSMIAIMSEKDNDH